MTIEVIVGCMSCGKTEEMLRRARRARIAGKTIQAFRPVLDDRGDPDHLKTLDGNQWEAITVDGAPTILSLVEEDTSVVLIDEAQFFDSPLKSVCQKLSARGMRVIVAGLDTDFRGEPFGPIPELLAIAYPVDKLTAICMVCGGEATRSQRLVEGKPAHWDDDTILTGWVGQGGEVTHQARCPCCHEVRRD